MSRLISMTAQGTGHFRGECQFQRGSQWKSPFKMRSLFEAADRSKLREARDPLPNTGPFTSFRGVGGRGSARRVLSHEPAHPRCEGKLLMSLLLGWAMNAP